jgi:hypothetical protein
LGQVNIDVMDFSDSISLIEERGVNRMYGPTEEVVSQNSNIPKGCPIPK